MLFVHHVAVYYPSIFAVYISFENWKRNMSGKATLLAQRFSYFIFSNVQIVCYDSLSAAYVDFGNVDARKVLRWTLNCVLQLGHLTSATFPKPLTPSILPK